MNVLVTGGAGYIGSHFVKLLLNEGVDVIVFDNLSRGHREAVPETVPFENVDLVDHEKLNRLLGKYSIDSVVHFAALAYVGESVDHPERYYQNNVVGSFNLINALNNAGIKNFIFSSTCSIYGNPIITPISENESEKPINPYANTKLTVEKILKDFNTAYDFKYISLRYFNAAGADPEGEIGESHEPETHLIPLVLETASGKKDEIKIFGDDYQTKDGTCIRDYIHVTDLADAHFKALKFLEEKNDSTIINLGTGEGNSVKEIVAKTEEVTGKKINSRIVERRAGDPAVLVADNSKAKELLGWVPQQNIEAIISSAWNWHLNKKY